MKVLMLYFYDAPAWRAMPPTEREDARRRIQRWQEQPEHARCIVHSGELPDRDEAVTVHLGPAGLSAEPRAASGPFLQAPDALGGYSILEVPSLDDAIALVRSWPAGGRFEIRPLLDS